jgi:hypothetical protein
MGAAGLGSGAFVSQLRDDLGPALSFLPGEAILKGSALSIAALKGSAAASPVLLSAVATPPATFAAAPSADNDGSTTTEPDGEASSREAAPRAATVLAAGTLAASVAGQEWAERVDRALAQTNSDTLSKAARLSRRLRRPHASHSRGARRC